MNCISVAVHVSERKSMFYTYLSLSLADPSCCCTIDTNRDLTQHFVVLGYMSSKILSFPRSFLCSSFSIDIVIHTFISCTWTCNEFSQNGSEVSILVLRYYYAIAECVVLYYIVYRHTCETPVHSQSPPEVGPLSIFVWYPSHCVPDVTRTTPISVFVATLH